MLRTLAWTLTAGLSLWFGTWLPAQTGFTIDDSLRLRIVHSRMPLDLTGDGGFVAYCVENRENHADTRGMVFGPTGVALGVSSTELWVVDVDRRAARKVSGEDERAWAPRWSPNGDRLAFFSDRGGRPRLWIAPREGEPMPVDGALVRTFFAFELPEWSPDGRYVYFKALSKDYEEFYGSANDGPQDELPFRPARPSSERSGDPNPAGPAAVRVSTAKQEVTTVRGGATSGAGILDLARFDTRSGEVSRLVRGIALRDFELSPDGRWLAFFVAAGRATTAQQPYRSVRLVRADGTAAPVVLEARGHEGYGQSLSWSPDSSHVCYATSGQLSQGDLIVFDVASRTRVNATADFDVNLGRGDWHEVRPLWTPDGSAILFAARGELYSIAADGSGVRNLTGAFEPAVLDAVASSEASVAHARSGGVLAQFENREGSGGGFAAVSLDGAGAEVVLPVDGAMPRQPRMHVDLARDGRMIFRRSGGDRPAQLVVVEGGDTVVLPDANDWIRSRDLGRLEILEWSLGNRTVRGLLVLPSKSTDQPPCVVKVYAGSSPSGRAGAFPPGGGSPDVEHPAFFLARGIAVFLPDLPISGNEPAAAILEAAEPALDALERSGLVDHERLGVFGHSYGGYTVYCLITQTDRFRAATASTGFGDLTSFYLRSAAEPAGTGYFERGQGAMGVPLWENVERYRRNSPVLRADRITTPLLIMHGQDDRYHDQAVQFYGAMKRLGKDCTFVSYANAEHWYGAWSNAKLRDFWTRVLDWFERHLK